MTIKTNVKMKLEHFHDFYFLQALKAGIAREIGNDPDKAFSRSVEKLELDLAKAMDEIIPNIALRTFVYLYAACFGESRHARETVAHMKFMPCTLSMHRTGIYKMSTDYRPTTRNLDALISMFEQRWKSGFGGVAWCKIAKALKMYFTDTPTSFIDHVIDLEHNGGTAFNKEDSNESLDFVAWYPTRLSYFLDYKFSKDILSERPTFLDYLKVTPKVCNLVRRFTTIFRKKPVDWIQPKLDTLDTYMVEWGNEVFEVVEKWSEWADVTNGNFPKAGTLLDMAGLEDIYPGHFTEKGLHLKVTEVKEQAFKHAGIYLTPTLKKQISRKLSEWSKWAMKQTKVEKKSITYQALPVKITPKGGYKFILTICVPFDGYGTESEEGFIAEVEIPGGYDLSKAKEGHITASGSYLQLDANKNNWLFTDKQLEAFLD